jgi:glycosyltransferase involved in cell wall biosynthesis
MNGLRIVVHDFSGHPLAVQLSRELAARGHQVLHLHNPAFESPKGPLEVRPSDPPGFDVQPVLIPGAYPKYSAARRLLQDWRYRHACMALIREFQAEIVLSAQALPYLQNWLRRDCRRAGISFVAWVQDLYGIGATTVWRRRFGWPGVVAGAVLAHMDETLALKSDAVVFISQDFIDFYSRLRPRASGRWYAIENWGPLAELPLRPRVNPWRAAHGLGERFLFLYAGTLGFKHNPELLAQLAVRAGSAAAVMVVSEGRGRTYLETRKRELGLENLLLLDYPDFASVADMHGSADVLVALIEEEAGAYCVPSKVLSYLCAGRPLLLSVPRINLAARIVTREGAGIVVDPGDSERFLEGAEALMSDPARAAELGARARRYAVATFDIAAIGSRFEEVLRETLRRPRE